MTIIVYVCKLCAAGRQVNDILPPPLPPLQSAASVHRSLVTAGKDLGLRHAGMHALNSLRLEAGQLQWGRDVSAMETPYEAGLGHLVCGQVCFVWLVRVHMVHPYTHIYPWMSIQLT